MPTVIPPAANTFNARQPGGCWGCAHGTDAFPGFRRDVPANLTISVHFMSRVTAFAFPSENATRMKGLAVMFGQNVSTDDISIGMMPSGFAPADSQFGQHGLGKTKLGRQGGAQFRRKRRHGGLMRVNEAVESGCGRDGRVAPRG